MSHTAVPTADGAAGARALHARLQSEMRLREGPVAESLADPLREAPTYQLTADAFILRLPSGLRFGYRRGEGVVYQRPASVPDADVTLFLNGSVYGAVSYLNGLIPLHASAVVHGGRVFAFTTASGGGKSTLAAGLAKRGFTVFADDVLALVPGHRGPVQCLPERKPVKLWSDAVALTGLAAGARVRQSLNKHYVDPGAVPSKPMPLAALYLLSRRSTTEARLSAVTGADRFNPVRGAFYRRLLGAALLEGADYFAAVARVSSAVPVYCFDRPWCKDRFWGGVDRLAAAIREGHESA